MLAQWRVEIDGPRRDQLAEGMTQFHRDREALRATW
jgi:hypothetical protein